VFPTSKVVANISPIRQKRLKDMLTVADNFMKQLCLQRFQDSRLVYSEDDATFWTVRTQYKIYDSIRQKLAINKVYAATRKKHPNSET